MNKKIILTSVVIIVVVIGYFVSNSINVEKTPTDTTSQGKLNINVACENALTYMTFENGASADKFVAECKEGKYPEVIEQYKAQMNLGEGTEI